MSTMVEVQDLPNLHSITAERATLGSMLIWPGGFWHVSDFLKPEHFYHEGHRHIYEAMMATALSGRSFDITTLAAGMKQEAERLAYLVGLVNEPANSVNLVAYAKQVEEFAIRRAMLKAAEKMASLSYGDMPIDETLSQAEAAVFNVRQGRADDAVKAPKDYALSALAEIEQRRIAGNRPGLQTGFSDVDKLMGGFKAPHVYILAGRPAMGKSAWAGNVALHLAKQGKRILFFSLEMSEDQIATRLFAAMTKIPLGKIQDGDLTTPEMVRLNTAAGSLAGLHLFIDTTPGLTPGQVRARSMRYAAEHGIDLVIVDHLHEMNPDTPKQARHLELGEMVRAIKATAKQLDCPVLLLAQLSRGLESRGDKRPMMSDLRESGALEEVAHTILFLYREHYYDEMAAEHVADCIVAKNRDGVTGSASLYWDGKRTEFGNLTREVRI